MQTVTNPQPSRTSECALEESRFLNSAGEGLPTEKPEALNGGARGSPAGRACTPAKGVCGPMHAHARDRGPVGTAIGAGEQALGDCLPSSQ